MTPTSPDIELRHTAPILLISIGIVAVGLLLFVMNLCFGSVSIPMKEIWVKSNLYLMRKGLECDARTFEMNGQ